MVGIWMMFYMPGFYDDRVPRILNLMARKKRTANWIATALKPEIKVNPPEVRKWLDMENGEPPKIKKYTEGEHIYNRILRVLQGDPGSKSPGFAPSTLRKFSVFSLGSPKPGVKCRLVSTDEYDFPYNGDGELYGHVVNDDLMSPALNIGDFAVFETVDDAPVNEVVHFHRDEEDMIACRRIVDDVQWAFPFDPDAKPFACPDWDVHGRCIGLRRAGPMGTVILVQFPVGLKWAMREIRT